MMTLNEESIESFIRENKDKFNVYRPPDSHLENFLFKLSCRIRNIISIVPYLVRVAVATVLIFLTSIMVWNNYIRKDRQEITLRDKITYIVNKSRIK
jgi:hypothetical protein